MDEPNLKRMLSYLTTSFALSLLKPFDKSKAQESCKQAILSNLEKLWGTKILDSEWKVSDDGSTLELVSVEVEKTLSFIVCDITIDQDGNIVYQNADDFNKDDYVFSMSDPLSGEVEISLRKKEEEKREE